MGQGRGYVPTMKKLALLICVFPMVTFGMDRLAALSMFETGDNDHMVGRAGEISRYQILKQEWRTVTNSTHYTDPATAKAVAVRLLEKRTRAFHATFKRPPTNFEIYGLWNAPGQVLQSRVSPRVSERCQRFANLCEAGESAPQPANSAAPSKAPVL